MKYVLITSIRSTLSEEEILDIAKTRKNHFKTVPGLRKKHWCRDDVTGVCHGILEFESKETVDTYLKTDFAKSVENVYKTIEPVKIQILRI